MEQLAEAQAMVEFYRTQYDDCCDQLAEAQAEVARLREALEKIATFDYKLRPTPEDLRDAARAALKGDV